MSATSMRKIWLIPLLIAPVAAGGLYLGYGSILTSTPTLARAERYVTENNPRAARIELLNLLKQNPADGAAHLLQGRVYLQLGDGVGAEAEIRRARETGIAADATHHLLAQALLLQGQPERALDEAMLAKGKFTADGLRIAGQAKAARGDKVGALALLQQAVAAAPNNGDIRADLGRVQLAMGDLAGAQASAKAAVGDGRNLNPLLFAGDVARAAGDLRGALGWYDRALKVAPDHVPSLLARAAALGDLGQTQKMVEIADQVLKLDGKNPIALFLKARLAAANKDYAGARDFLQQAGNGLDRNPAAMLLGAQVAHRLGNNELAIERLTRLLTIEPDNVTAKAVLGAAQLGAGDPLAAVATLQPLVDAGQADRETRTTLAEAMKRAGSKQGDAYARRAGAPDPKLIINRLVSADRAMAAGNWAEAVQVYEGLRTELGDHNAIIVNNLAWAYLRLGNGKAAEAAAARAVALDPNNPSVGDTYGWILHSNGREPAKAMATLLKAHRAAPANADIGWHLAQVYVAQGRKDEARTLLTALIGNPKFREKDQARAALAKL